MNPKALEALRQIDKLDQLGVDGVCSMLGEGLTDKSGAFNRGVGLDWVQVGMLRKFLEVATEPDKPVEDMLIRLGASIKHIQWIKRRIDFIVFLDSDVTYCEKTGTTALDRVNDWLLPLPVNKDNTWNNGGRPRLDCAFDDILYLFLNQGPLDDRITPKGVRTPLTSPLGNS